MKSVFARSVLFFGMLLSCAQTYAGAEELKLFVRCYYNLTGRALPLNHALRSDVVNGTMTAAEACGQVLDKAALRAPGYTVSDAEGLSVLRNLYDFHRSWFPTQAFEAMEGGDPSGGNTQDLFDSTEPALVLTYNLFGEETAGVQENYKDVLRYSSGMTAIRVDDVAFASTNMSTYVPFPSRRVAGNVAGKLALVNTVPTPNPTPVPMNVMIMAIKKIGAPWTTPAVGSDYMDITSYTIQVGDLVGIKRQSPSRSISLSNYWPGFIERNLGLTGDLKYYYSAADETNLVGSLDPLASNGGGILGLPSFMMLNWGHEVGLRTNGSTKLPRRWIKTAMDSLLCTEFPVVRETDVIQYVASGTDPDTATFRKAASCVQCHATLDQLAMTGRNQFVAMTDARTRSFLNPSAQQLAMMGRYKTTLPAQTTWSAIPVADFPKQTPSGRLYFRSSNGALVNTPVANIAEAGEALSNTDDLYQCAVKRYFEYFTHISVPLYDRGNPSSLAVTRALSAEAIRQRQFIERVADQFKSHQSLRKVIKDIIASEYFRAASPQPQDQ